MDFLSGYSESTSEPKKQRIVFTRVEIEMTTGNFLSFAMSFFFTPILIPFRARKVMATFNHRVREELAPRDAYSRGKHISHIHSRTRAKVSPGADRQAQSESECVHWRIVRCYSICLLICIRFTERRVVSLIETSARDSVSLDLLPTRHMSTNLRHRGIDQF